MTRGKRFHILPALTVNGLLEYLVYPGSTTGDAFFLWLAKDLLPKMNPYPGPNSVLVMDNASWHLGQQLEAACEAAGVRLIYLPPYSPDFNPIETYFGDLKTYMRRVFNPYEQAQVSDEFFMRFLRDCAIEVASRTEQIRAHFGNCCINLSAGQQGSGDEDGDDGGGSDVEGSEGSDAEGDSGYSWSSSSSEGSGEDDDEL